MEPRTSIFEVGNTRTKSAVYAILGVTDEAVIFYSSIALVSVYARPYNNGIQVM